MIRCPWAGEDPLYIDYHDHEWGVPVHEDRLLFEFLVLEGVQAGLSWITVLRKRERYREAFDNFEPARVAQYGKPRLEALLTDAGLIRNRLKMNAAVKNAQACLRVQEEFGTLDAYLWGFVDGAPLLNACTTMAELPAETELSRALSKDLRRRGFSFVGPTICYAFMQAAGLVNDHLTSCFRYAELGGTVSPP